MGRQRSRGMGFALILVMHELHCSAMSLETMRCNLEAARSSWHNRCVASGRENSKGLGLHFEVNEQGQVEASFTFPGCYEGFAHGLIGMTGELNLRFRHVVDIGRTARVWAWLERSSHRLHLLRARLEQGGEIRATASGKFLEIPANQKSKNHGGAYG